MYVGRFAPSPTGPLHFGSLLAALASYLDARRAGGRWLLRIEDVDPPREPPGAADAILRTLEAFALYWDGEVLYQSTRSDAYEAALAALRDAGDAYPCTCSRSEVQAAATGTVLGGEGPRYPGTCRDGPAEPARQARAWRLRTAPDEASLHFTDRLQGRQRCESPSRAIGDFVLKRRDGLFAYQLAVVVDDHWQGVTDVVRGTDLLTSTFRQMLVRRALGLGEPRHAHFPVVTDASGQKLSKQSGAAPVVDARDAGPLWRALALLRQNPPQALRHSPPAELLAWAVTHWNPERLRGIRSVPLEAP